MNAREAMRRHTAWTLTPPEHMTPGRRRIRAETKVANALAQVVYDRRTELGWTKTELAKRAAMDVRMITRLEDGARPPTTPTLLRMAEALGGRIVVDHDGDESTVTFSPHDPGTDQSPKDAPRHGETHTAVQALLRAGLSKRRVGELLHLPRRAVTEAAACATPLKAARPRKTLVPERERGPVDA